MDKIKSFLNNIVVQIVEVVTMILCAVGLFVGGWEAQDFHSLVDYVGCAIVAILAIVKFIKTILHRNGSD